MSLEELISSYGYAAIGIGTFLEGETILVLGGFSAHRGYLDLPWVIFSGFLGTLLGDQLYFHIGRAKGEAFLLKRESWRAKSETVFGLLGRHRVWLIVGFRFMYGFRTITPFLLGAAKVSPGLFLALNCVGAAMWAIVIGAAGYFFGQTLEALLGEIKRYELIVFAVLAAAGGLVWIRYGLRRRRR